MSRRFEVDPARPAQAAEAVRAAAEALQGGSLVIVPTETVYGIAARPDDPAATRRLFEAKRRPRGLTLPVLAATSPAALALARPDLRAAALAEAFWPGPLTIVAPRSEASAGWDLGERSDSVGLRVPDHPITHALLARAGALAATSANLSGRAPLADEEALVETFGEAVEVYLVLAPGSPTPGGTPSTVVEVTGPEPVLLREGAVPAARVAAALRRSGSPGRLGRLRST